MLTIKDILTSSGKYPDRESHPECTEEVKNNAKKLIDILNPFLEELGIKNPVVSSGFRTSDANAALANSAKKSLHMQGLACDLSDIKGTIDKLVESRDDLKKKYGIWQESPASTNGWCHLDIKSRGKRDKNTFNP